jgi:dipeptidyl aminopeptidase/acylaminoacyl peptidase
MKTVVLFSIVPVAAFAARPAFTPQDLWNWHTASDPHISPDASLVVYTEAWNDRAANKSFSNLWIVATRGGPPKRFTEGNWRDWSPRWDADGKRLAWISDRGGEPRIYIAPAPSATPPVAEPRPSGSGVPITIAWSPEGDSIAYTARAPNRRQPPAWAPPDILPRLRTERETTIHLFLLPLKGGQPRQLSAGELDLVGEPSWTLDGRTIAMAREDGVILAITTAGGAPVELTHDAAFNQHPVFSPDGSKLAWLATSGGDQSYATRKLCVMNPDGSRVNILSGSLDRDASDPQWNSDSRTVYFLADENGATHIYAAHRDGKLRQVTSGAERLRDFSLADNGRGVAIRSTWSAAGDVYTFTVDHITQPATLASPNEHLLAKREIAPAEEMRYTSAGNTVQAWLVKPPSFDPAKKYPLLADVQDDPRAMYGNEFNLRAQIAAARGFIVLCANPRGTPGYGEVFGNLLHTALPGDDYDDLMAGVNAAVAKGFVDPQRLAIAGGLVAAWAIGHTDRFRAAVALHPITDWAVDVATSRDGLRRARSWMGAMPWENPDQYTKRSPVSFAQNFRTPTLILARDSDAQAEELYFALRARKVETAFVRIPASPDPAGEIAELEAVLGWLSAHTASGPRAN